MGDTLRILVALTVTFLVRVRGDPQSGYCTEEKCFGVFLDRVDFTSAQEVCKRMDGNLMTVESEESHKILPVLLGNLTGDFWIGLQLPSGQCPDSASPLWGYRWITGNAATNFTNWRQFGESCSSKCVSVSRPEFKWTEESCGNKLAFICEYTLDLDLTCQGLPIEKHELVRYVSPFGFEVEPMPLFPMGTIATHKSLERKYICFQEWKQAPWICEVKNGGCEHGCVSSNQVRVCTCPPEKTLHSDNVTCREANLNSDPDPDPCSVLGCAHLCSKKDDSYECVCRHGYALAEDGRRCEDVDECVDDRHCPGQNSKCENSIGGFECLCQEGYQVDNGQCVDEDECFMRPCEHECINTLGSYKCYCDEGYMTSTANPDLCEAVCLYKECPAECDPNNNKNCNCPKGFTLDRRGEVAYCVDNDECEMYSDCENSCTNTYGSYECSCDEGFDLIDGTKCVERQEAPTQRPPMVKAGGLLGIVVCIVVVIFVTALLVHHSLKRCGKLELAFKSQVVDIYHLQQVTTEKYRKLSFDRHLKSDIV